MHILYKDGKSMIGTARYASINTHLGIEQSRRDDLESVGYVLLYFLRGELPWQGLKAKNMKEKYEKIKEKKISISVDFLCKGFPTEIKNFVCYVRNLQFDDRPDYKALKKLFRTIAEREKFEYDFQFDWVVKKAQLENDEEKKVSDLNTNNNGNNIGVTNANNANNIGEGGVFKNKYNTIFWSMKMKNNQNVTNHANISNNNINNNNINNNPISAAKK